MLKKVRHQVEQQITNNQFSIANAPPREANW